VICIAFHGQDRAGGKQAQRARRIERRQISAEFRARETAAEGRTGRAGHFSSKDDLAAAATRAAFDRSEKKWHKIAVEAKHPLADLIDNYLRHSHRDNPGAGCAMPSLGAEPAAGAECPRGFHGGAAAIAPH
jgi:hypothetical protein